MARKGCVDRGLEPYQCADGKTRWKARFAYNGKMKRSMLFETKTEARRFYEYARSLRYKERLANGFQGTARCNTVKVQAQQGIYFMQPIVGGLIKIGHSSFLARRVASLRTMSPVELVLIGVIHMQFAYLRKHGEWFAPEPELIRFITSLKLDLSPSSFATDSPPRPANVLG